MFFFRFHNLRREEEKRNNRRNKKRRSMQSDNMTAPSRLHERPHSEPVDLLDEIAEQIPRLKKNIFYCSFYLLER